MNHARRQKQYHWLETHIWHAKRFKMTPKWGFKLAEFSRQRGVRAGYRAAAHQCTIYDCSYLCCVELIGNFSTPYIQILWLWMSETKSALSGTEESIVRMLRSLSPSDSPLAFASKMLFLQHLYVEVIAHPPRLYRYLDGSRQGVGVMYQHNQYPLGFITPYYFMWRPEAFSNRTLWLWIHPAAFEESLKELSIASGSINSKGIFSKSCHRDNHLPSVSGDHFEKRAVCEIRVVWTKGS